MMLSHMPLPRLIGGVFFKNLKNEENLMSKAPVKRGLIFLIFMEIFKTALLVLSRQF